MTKAMLMKSYVIVQTLNILIRWRQAIVNRPVLNDHTEKKVNILFGDMDTLEIMTHFCLLLEV